MSNHFDPSSAVSLIESFLQSLPVEHGGFGELPSLFPGRSVLANILSTEDKRIVWVSLREIDCPLTSPDDERLVFRMFSHYQRELQRLRKLAGAGKTPSMNHHTWSFSIMLYSKLFLWCRWIKLLWVMLGRIGVDHTCRNIAVFSVWSYPRIGSDGPTIFML